MQPSTLLCVVRCECCTLCRTFIRVASHFLAFPTVEVAFGDFYERWLAAVHVDFLVAPVAQ
jgi:hypothetical protein